VEATHQNYQAWGRRLPQTLLLTLPNRANGTRCARLQRGGRLPDPFFWPTKVEKFCLGVNSVTPEPFVSISFVSTGTKFGHVTMNSPTWIESEKAISHCQFLSLIAFVFGWYKVLCSEKALVTRKKRKKRLTLLPLFYLLGVLF